MNGNDGELHQTVNLAPPAKLVRIHLHPPDISIIMKKLHHGLYEVQCDLNLDKLKNSCYTVFDSVKNLDVDPVWIDNPGQPSAPSSTKKILQYNLFTYVLPKIPELYKFIRSSFYQIELDHYSKNLNLNYYIQSWVNVYKHNQFVDWHGHHYPVGWAWHGFFCVDTEPSNTQYRFDNGTIVTVPSINNKLVLGLCENNEHKSDIWPYIDRDRITIAFDIIPESGLINSRPNHWVPI